MAALVATLLRIIIDLLIVTLIYDLCCRLMRTARRIQCRSMFR